MLEWIAILLLRAHVNTFLRMSVAQRREMRQGVVELAQRKKSAGSCRVQYVKNKELLVAPGKLSLTVVLATKAEKLGHCLHRLENYSQLSCLSCARQIVRLAYSCSTITSRCNEPLEKLRDSPECLTPPRCAQTLFSTSIVGKRTWQA